MLHIRLSDEPLGGIKGNPGDNRVLEFVLSQKEGDAALAEITLIPGSPTHAWCAVAEDDDLLFVGQLVGISDQDAHTFKTTYRACAAMPITPTHLPYDPLFFDEPHISQYLEASPYLFYFDRCTGIPELSHIHQGQRHYHLSHILKLETNTLHTPCSAIKASVKVEWLQKHEGVFDLAPSIHAACDGGQLTTLTPEHLKQAWPKEGPFLPLKRGQHNGYKVIESHITEGYKSSSQSWFQGSIWIHWQYAQKRLETVHFEISQDLPNAWQTGQVHLMKWRLQAVDDLENPTISTSSPSFFNTERGQKALQYAIQLTHHHLIMSRRCLETKITLPFNVLPHITLDTSVSWGKDLEGKIAGYRFVKSAQHAYGEIIVRRQVKAEMQDPQLQWKPLNPEGFLDTPPTTLVEKIEIHNGAEDQRRHILSGGSLQDVPTKIFIKLAELGKPYALHQTCNLGNFGKTLR